MNLLRYLLLICMMQSFGVIAQPTQLPEKFNTGELRYDCTYSCTGKAVASWAKLRQIYQEKKWNELIIGADEIGLDSRYTYLLFARSAQELGYGASAEKYFDVAMASGIATTGCSPAAQTAFCDQMILDLGLGSQCNTLLSCMKVKMTGTKLTIAKSTVASEQTYLISTDTKQKEVIEPTQIKADVSNQVVNSGDSNNSLRRVEQPLFDKSTTPQLNVQTSNISSQILIDACKALQDLQKKSDCLETILRMGQSGNNPPLRSKQNSNELEGLYTAVTTLVTSISSGTTVDSFNEKVNIAIVERSKIRANDYGEVDKKFVEDLLNIIISAEDFKFVRNLRNNSSGRDQIIVNPGDEHFKIATKYGLSPDNFIVWGLYFRQQPVLDAISEAIEKNYEIAIQKKKLRYQVGYSLDQKKADLKETILMVLDKDPYKYGIKDFKMASWKAQAELIVFCESEVDVCQSNGQGDTIRNLLNNTNDVAIVWQLAKVNGIGGKIRPPERLIQKYQFTGPYTTGFLGVKALQPEILTAHILDTLKKRIIFSKD